MKDCIEVKKSGDQSEMKERQYGAWLRGEAGDKVMEKNCPKEGPKGKSGNLRSTIPTHKDADKKKTPNKTDEVVQGSVFKHERGKATVEHQGEIKPDRVEGSQDLMAMTYKDDVG
nr:hypothetical protein CFP56_39987 [Quercus suber]